VISLSSMARPLRIQFKNAYYHVMNRGVARCATFSRDEHYELFLALLADIVERFGIEIHCYCLMNNHSPSAYKNALC
jgi:putative transposase